MTIHALTAHAPPSQIVGFANTIGDTIIEMKKLTPGETQSQRTMETPHKTDTHGAHGGHH